MTTDDDSVFLPAGTSIFDITDDGRRCAELKWAHGQSLGYEMGYRRAADLIAEDIQTHGLSVDSLVFPLAYLWRHAVELQLKRIIRGGSEWRGADPPTNLEHHRLSKLWALARAEVVALDDCVPEGTAFVDHVLQEVDTLDPGSTGFRYPGDWSRKPVLNSPPEQLDLLHSHNVLANVELFLNITNDMISQRLNGE